MKRLSFTLGAPSPRCWPPAEPSLVGSAAGAWKREDMTSTWFADDLPNSLGGVFACYLSAGLATPRTLASQLAGNA